MAKLFMIQTALHNLTQEGTAEVVGTGWSFSLDEGNRLFVDCGDEGFTYQFYYLETDSFSEIEALESVSELKELLA